MQRKTNKTRTWRPYLEKLESRRLLSIWADFNADGFDDLAVGAPGEDVGSIVDAGAVHLIFSGSDGLKASDNQLWTQDSTDILDTAETGDGFGTALAGGDFNADGFADLAIGMPFEDIGTVVDAGAIHVLYGSATGFNGSDDFLHQDTNRVRDVAEAGDLFGSSLASGDFNKDGFSDLAVGVPGQDLPGKAGAGGIHIFYGGGAGLKPPGNQTFNEDSPAMAGLAAAGNAFGTALAAGDFNGDAKADLAIGSPGSLVGTADDSGALIFVYAGASGLAPTGSGSFLAGDPDARLGSALASGDFDGDGLADLAAGAPFGTVGAVTGAGVIRTFNGAPAGLATDLLINQTNLGGGNVSETGDDWGAALTAGDFNGDGRDDLAIGAPGETGAATDAGQVDVLFGSASGITTSGDVNLTEASAGGTAEVDDHFGETLGAGDYNGDGAIDLAIGTPDENVGAIVDAGTVYVLYGGATFTGAQTWTQDTTDIVDTAEAGDGFGGGLDSGAGRDNSGPRDPAHLITADFDSDTPFNKLNKRRVLSGRR